MNYKYVYPSFTWVIGNATSFDSVREEKRFAPTFFPAPSVLWFPPKDTRGAQILLGVCVLLLISFASGTQ
jgi:hypothetical protein